VPAGLPVLVLPSDSQVAYCGIAVRAGTRNETLQQYGMAHFCEHLAFKGTAKRSAIQIINAIEGVGGELNAFTNKEDTVFYCAVQKQYLGKAIAVLCDMVFNSHHPQQEVEKEREVVCDEIESYEDTPSELIYDEIEDILFLGHPLGHNILGNKEQLRSYTSADTQAFIRQWYRPENCLLFVSGSLTPSLTPDPGLTPRSAEGRLQGKNPIPDVPSPTRSLSPRREGNFADGVIMRQRGTHQAHVMLGTRAFSAKDERRWALYLLNNILGGPALNSRLSLQLRERHGLVYNVDSAMTCYSDAGLWTVYFGCDQHDVKRCLRLVRSELDRLMDKPLSATQLNAAKRQLKGQLAIACDNREQFVIDNARNYLHTGRERRLEDIIRHIDSLTPQDLQLTAQQVFAPESITTLIYN
jgi:predicted Zn-dependent peptidase